MILLPAIDIRAGRAVRLAQGDFDRETVYADAPLDAARVWVEQGARGLHVVDLDGAREGSPASLDHLRAIASELGVPVQYGGGLRSLGAVRDAFAAGADRVVLGTAAYADERLLAAALEAYGERVRVAVDVRGGRVTVSGWAEGTGLRPQEAIERLEGRGVREVVYTSADRDGMLTGPDLDEVRRVGAAVHGRFVYSGGIGSIQHLEALRALGVANLVGVICGKALYEGRFTVAEGQARLDGTGR
ncbi:MAG: 1-(5-phosphoribosyl)-5-[(5-phosphoribosylamino)methylideneamino]imidazole-4-carboxamide isomerase [Actinomycetota bacterium]|nr:1-(5-phosphoribosyl)-5-[(5-phosphoribosylamino)methylideneamino]imidazole-4-carboxamide isomerase [Actinomycetota bacterium]